MPQNPGTGQSSDAERTALRPEEDEDWSDSSDSDEPVLTRRNWVRLAWLAVAIGVVALLAVLPPLVNVNRYQRRVAQAISGAVGRPVHFDNITMHLLPLPGFTIQNFVVQEDPAFGVEPALRANIVQARVRFASLWRRRIEISRIRLEAPSVNLVRREDGRWNLQGVVLQASQLENAPTGQARHSDSPRFPYIEAVDARINIKQGEDKLPWSLVDSKFALWLPNQDEWRLRLEGRPLRTDTDVSDVGSLNVEGSLGRSNNGVSGEKLDLRARLDSTPMGEAAKLVLGHDTGWRGAASAELTVKGTPATMMLTTDLHLHNLRRSDFVPRLPMSVDAHCEGQALGGFHQLHAVHCAIPTRQSRSVMDVMNLFENRQEHVLAAPDVLRVGVEVSNTLDWQSANIEADLRRGSPEWVLGWLRLFSTRLPAEEQVGGYVALHAETNGGLANWHGGAECHCSFPAEKPLQAKTADATNPAADSKPNPWIIAFTHAPGDRAKIDTIAVTAGPSAAETNTVTDTAENVAAAPAVAAQPAVEAVSGQISRSGYTLRYDSAETARYAASLLPPLGDALKPDGNGPMQAERKWAGEQVWTSALPARPAKRPAHRHGR